MAPGIPPFPCFLFLDIDGVLVTGNDAVRQRAQGLPDRDEYGHLFDPDCVGNLDWLVRESGAGIVLSSAWRVHDLRDVRFAEGIAGQEWCDGPFRARALWAHRGLPGTIVDATPYFTAYFPEGKYWHLPRGIEIEAWQRRHGTDRVPYAIVDDDSDMLLMQQSRFVQTDVMGGLTREKAEAALAMLRKPVLWPWEEERLAASAAPDPGRS